VMPARRPRVQTFVAMKVRFGSGAPESNSPSTASARPYIGELSNTLPPALRSVWTTSASALNLSLLAPMKRALRVDGRDQSMPSCRPRCGTAMKDVVTIRSFRGAANRRAYCLGDPFRLCGG
jgi:hypothetical protein